MKLENVHVQDSAAEEINRIWQTDTEKASHFAGGVLVLPETQQEVVAVAHNHCVAVLKSDHVAWWNGRSTVSIPILLMSHFGNGRKSLAFRRRLQYCKL